MKLTPKALEEILFSAKGSLLKKKPLAPIENPVHVDYDWHLPEPSEKVMRADDAALYRELLAKDIDSIRRRIAAQVQSKDLDHPVRKVITDGPVGPRSYKKALWIRPTRNEPRSLAPTYEHKVHVDYEEGFEPATEALYRAQEEAIYNKNLAKKIKQLRKKINKDGLIAWDY